MFDERNRRISICLPFSLIFPTSLEGYHAGTLKDGAVNCLNERERNVSIKKITQFELINYFSKYLYHRYDWADSWNYDPKILKAPVTPVDTCAKILSSSQMVKFPILFYGTHSVERQICISFRWCICGSCQNFCRELILNTLYN